MFLFFGCKMLTLRPLKHHNCVWFNINENNTTFFCQLISENAAHWNFNKFRFKSWQRHVSLSAFLTLILVQKCTFTWAKSAWRASRGTTEESWEASTSLRRESVWLRDVVGPRSGGGSSTCSDTEPAVEVEDRTQTRRKEKPLHG